MSKTTAAMADLPPSYDQEVHNTSTSSSDILKPTTLYVAERFIHSSDPQAPPLYEISHSIGFLRDSDRKVTMERLDYSVRQAPDSGTPSVSTRKRPLYDLAHRTPGEMPNFSFQAEAQSRVAAAGSLGIETLSWKKRFSLSGKKGGGYRVVRAHWGKDRRLAGGGDAIFTAAPPSSKAGGVSWEWSNEVGDLVAREVMKDDLLSLVVTAEMGQGERDALVASWLMRLWWEQAEHGSFKIGMKEHAKRVFAHNSNEMPNFGNGVSFLGSGGV